MVVLVTGALGQLGQAIRHLAPKFGSLEFVYTDYADADITNAGSLQALFQKVKPTFCINAAAYTAVDKAESEPEKAYAINVTGAKNLAEACKEHGATLIHISTDFVFDGTKTTPYTEEDDANPQSVYGVTKKQGEEAIEKTFDSYYIIRTAWLYSEYASNFMKTMLRLASERDSLGVVNDQKGTPTNANDLAEAIFQIITSGKKAYGLYHFSNDGEATWYDFAKEIFRVNNVSIDLKPILTTDYPTPAKRPAYSVLNKSRIKETFNLKGKDWKESVKKYE